MPTRSIAAALASLLLAGASLAQDAPAPAPAPAPQDAKAAPRIVVEPAAIDLGKITDDSPVHGNITIRNDGNADLVISGLKSTCGCTIPTLAGMKMDTKNKQSESTTVTLKPGESAPVDVEFHPAGKRDKSSQKVTINCNDPARREVVVEIVAFVNPIVRCDPDVIAFGEVERNQAKTIVATITGRTPGFAIPLVTTGSDVITAKILDTVDTEEEGVKIRQVRVEFTLNSPHAMTIGGVAVLRTTDPRRRIHSLPMTGTVLGDLSLDPSKSIPLGVATPGGTVEKSVRMLSRSGRPFKVLDVKERGMDNSPATWELVEAGPDAPGAFDLRLTFTAPQKPGSWTGTLVIATDVPDQEKIEVPYRGSIRPVKAPGAEPNPPSPSAPPAPRADRRAGSGLLVRALAIGMVAVAAGAAHSWIQPVKMGLRPRDPAAAPSPTDTGPTAATPDIPKLDPPKLDPKSDPAPSGPVDVSTLGQFITLAETKALYDANNYVFIDTRTKEEYDKSHILGAFHLSTEQIGTPEGGEVLAMLSSTTHYVLYCEGGECDASVNVAQRLEDAFPLYHIMKDSFKDWQAAGYDVDPEPGGAP